MSDDQPQARPAEQIPGDQRTEELPGTIGCVAAYAVMTLISLCLIVPSPYGLILAAAMTLMYIGLIALFGQGSIIEMGLFAFILLVLCCLIAVAARGRSEQNRTDKTSPNQSLSRSGGPIEFALSWFSPPPGWLGR